MTTERRTAAVAERTETRGNPHRDQLGHPIWEGKGWLVCAAARLVAVEVQADTELAESFADIIRTASYWAVVEAGSSRRAHVAVRARAPHRADSWALLDFSRRVILPEIALFTARELTAPRTVLERDRLGEYAEAKFEVVVR